MLPGRGLIARIRGKGDAYGAILASWALGPPQCKEGMRGFMGRRGGRRRWRARRVAALGQATQRVAASAERARRTQRWWARWARQWWVLRCRGAADRHGGAGAACGGGDGAGTRRCGGRGAGAHGATGAMEAGDSWPRGVGAHSAQYANAGSGYSPKLASIAATRSSSAPMSCWFTSSIFCKSAGEAFST